MQKLRRCRYKSQSGAALTRQLPGYARKGQYVASTVNLNHLIEETQHAVQRTNKNISVQSLLNETIQEPIIMDKAALISGRTLLLVEDEPLIQKYSIEMIKSLDFEVIAASSGNEAVRIYKEQYTGIDLVILDMIMPGMDGCAVFRLLNEINPHVKVILTSGFTLDRRTDQMLSSGIHGYLKKPYTFDELAEQIAKTLGARAKIISHFRRPDLG